VDVFSLRWIQLEGRTMLFELSNSGRKGRRWEEERSKTPFLREVSSLYFETFCSKDPSLRPRIEATSSA